MEYVTSPNEWDNNEFTQSYNDEKPTNHYSCSGIFHPPRFEAEVVANEHGELLFSVYTYSPFNTELQLKLSINDRTLAEKETHLQANSSQRLSLIIDINKLKKDNGDVKLELVLQGQSQTLLTLSKSMLLSSVEEKKELVNLLPSYGYLGGLKHEPLTLTLNKKANAVHLYSLNTNAYLNFNNLKIYDENNALLGEAAIDSVEVSSNVSSNDAVKVITAGTGFHSKREAVPQLSVTFKEATYVSRIELINRRDKWGSRANSLTIKAQLENNTLEPLYNLHSADATHQTLQQLNDVLAHYQLPTDGRTTRHELINAIICDFENKLSALTNADFTLPIQMLSTWNETYKRTNDETHELELKLLALYVFFKTKKSLSLSLSSFSRLLEFSDDIEFLETCINDYRQQCELLPIKLTKHGAARQGMLVSNTEDVLNTLDKVMQDLSNLGVNPCLAYGTLLGAKREGAFISHDDDVDILIELSKTPMHEHQVKEVMQQFLDKLDSSEYRISTGSKTTKTYNVHIFHKKTNIMIDVFPYWYNEDKAYLHMEKMAIKGIPKEILEKRTTIKLYNKTFSAPADITGFLELRYGETWSVSDRYHEWPWVVKEKN